MKRFFLLATFVCATLFTSCEGYDDSELVNRLNDFETRLKQLEETCKQLNTNISSLQTIVNAIQKNDQITAIAPVSKDGVEVGYTISFTSGKTITIYHGADGEDGTNGTNGSNGQNGADGHTPVIGVKMDADGIYYWTIDGEWLTDENGNKIQASPSEADSGTDGKDGVTPQLKIENEYWYVSYDNGQTWIKLGKATGEQGEQGPQGPQGSNGDSIFQSVTQDSNNVYFKLADGTTITIPKASGTQSIALTYIPRYSDGKATVFYSSKSDSYVELDFEVSPASAAANWRDAATVKAVYTETRAGVQMVDMAILSWTVDSDAGTITVKASGANLSDAFFAGTQEASARLAIDDDNLNLLSDYIPMVAKKTNAQPTPEPLESITLSTPIEFDYTLSCADFKGIITWERLVNDILAKFDNNHGMSYADFVKNYYGVSNSNLGNVVFNNDSNPGSSSSTIITWTVTTAQLGKVMDSNGNQTVTQKTISVKFQSKDEYTYPSYYVTFKMNIKLPAMPVMNGYRSALWSVDGQVAKVFPVQYKTSFKNGETCSYNYDFDQLFVNSQLVKNLLPCGTWAYVWTDEAKEIVANAVLLSDQNVYRGVVTPTTAGATNVAEAITDEYVKLIEENNVPTAEAKAILGKNAALNVMAKINAYNPYKVSTFELNFVEPLKINTTLEGAYFVDQVVSGSTVDCKNAFSLTDFNNYIVKNVADNAAKPELEKYTQSLWSYYVVNTPAWNLDEAVINIQRDANNNMVVVDDLAIEDCIKVKDYFGVGCLYFGVDYLTMSIDYQTLIWKNVSGTRVEKKAKIYVPVTVSHKWGAISDYVAIEMYPEY